MGMNNVQFLKAYDEMCRAMNCKKCPIAKLGTQDMNFTCGDKLRNFPEEAAEIITTWANEHITYYADFIKKHPEAMTVIRCDKPVPMVCRKQVYGGDLLKCYESPSRCVDCWYELYI